MDKPAALEQSAAENPYATPRSEVQRCESGFDDGTLGVLISGQKLVNYAALLYLAVIVVSLAGIVPADLKAWVAGALMFACLGLGAVGTYKISSGLGSGWFVGAVRVLLLLFPIVGFLNLAVLNGKASSKLRAEVP